MIIHTHFNEGDEVFQIKIKDGLGIWVRLFIVSPNNLARRILSLGFYDEFYDFGYGEVSYKDLFRTKAEAIKYVEDYFNNKIGELDNKKRDLNNIRNNYISSINSLSEEQEKKNRLESIVNKQEIL